MLLMLLMLQMLQMLLMLPESGLPARAGKPLD